LSRLGDGRAGWNGLAPPFVSNGCDRP
jgi:hypothetical protein